MKIKLTERVIVSGHAGAQPGDVLEVSPSCASTLIQMGKAVEFAEPAKSAPEVVQTREPVVENRDPVAAPAKRGKRP